MRVLIIDDNIDLAVSMKTGLNKLGFYADTANTAFDGEEKVFINEYDVILLHLNLPDKDGLEVLKKLRSDGNNTPVIIVSARDEIDQRTFGLDLSCIHVYTPFHLLVLY